MFKYHSCLEILFIQLTCQAHIKKVYEKKKTGLVYWKPICNSDGTYSTTDKNVSFNRILNNVAYFQLLLLHNDLKFKKVLIHTRIS